jgi:4-amino-4-deoxy-L-arabinose transferase-like glycosyltransferase
MIDWLSATPWRMPVILIAYFSLHVVARSLVSPSLDYDESEQIFLSQCLSYGYNSQPPLYTWVQTGLFEILGYSVFSLAVLKNLLLCGTYLLVFGLVRKATDNVSLGAIAALGLLTIPQISWESHRDLSHTVAVTFATMLTFYSVASLAKDGRTRWYVLIGIATALGVLSKYNFAIVIVGMIAAGLTVPTYRKQLLDGRMALAVAIAAAMILPHAIWAAAHLELTSSKTMATLTTNQSNDWFQNVGAGFAALTVSTLACCAITLTTFLPCVYRHLQARSRQEPSTSCSEGQATTLLLERFLIAITIVLCALVLSGHALEFKNRWLQPFVVLLPAYFVLRLRNFFPSERRVMNRVCAIGFLLIVLILTAVVTRPLIGRYRNQYCWLNIPYNELASTINDQIGNAPAIIVAPNMRIAGNLRLHFPESFVISEDQKYLSNRILATSCDELQTCKVVVVTDETKVHAHDRLMAFVKQTLPVLAESRDDWHRVDLDYLYGTGDAHQPFFLRELGVERVALQPSWTADKTR